MGPDATIYFFDRIVRNTPAGSDQNHLPIMILNWPQIPDRTSAVYGNGEDPVPLVQKGINQLAKNGSELISMPCVSIHYFLDRIYIPTGIEFLNILNVTAENTLQLCPEIKRVGILGTDLTVRENLFFLSFKYHFVEVIIPQETYQSNFVMKAIYQIKAGLRLEPKLLLLKAIQHLMELGAEAIISGCTEIPIVIQQNDISIPFIDCLDSLAKAVVHNALRKNK
jgi:aspartate racemase